jgi:hypothetical protein
MAASVAPDRNDHVAAMAYHHIGVEGLQRFAQVAPGFEVHALLLLHVLKGNLQALALLYIALPGRLNPIKYRLRSHFLSYICFT